MGRRESEDNREIRIDESMAAGVKLYKKDQSIVWKKWYVLLVLSTLPLHPPMHYLIIERVGIWGHINKNSTYWINKGVVNMGEHPVWVELHFCIGTWCLFDKVSAIG